MKRNTVLLIQDFFIIGLSIVLAIFLVKAGVITKILASTKGWEVVESFVAGIFFSSVFTTAPATVMLGQIAQQESLWLTAISGALGAMLADIVIFKLVRDRLSLHLMKLLKENGNKLHRLRSLFRLKFFRWFPLLIGGLIIASPLPDELGISLVGAYRMKLSFFIPFSFVANFGGILLIGIVARTVV